MIFSGFSSGTSPPSVPESYSPYSPADAVLSIAANPEARDALEGGSMGAESYAADSVELAILLELPQAQRDRVMSNASSRAIRFFILSTSFHFTIITSLSSSTKTRISE